MPVTEFNFRMTNKIILNRMPIVLIVSDALALLRIWEPNPQGLKLHQIVCQSLVLVTKNLSSYKSFQDETLSNCETSA